MTQMSLICTLNGQCSGICGETSYWGKLLTLAEHVKEVAVLKINIDDQYYCMMMMMTTMATMMMISTALFACDDCYISKICMRRYTSTL